MLTANYWWGPWSLSSFENTEKRCLIVFWWVLIWCRGRPSHSTKAKGQTRATDTPRDQRLRLHRKERQKGKRLNENRSERKVKLQQTATHECMHTPPLNTVLVSTFALWRVLAAIPEDVDLVDSSIRLEQLLQLLLRPGAWDLAHKHLDGVRVRLVRMLQRPVHLSGRAVTVGETGGRRLDHHDRECCSYN